MRQILATREQDLVQKTEGILRLEKEFLSEKLERNKSKLKDQISEISQDDYQCQTLVSMKQELEGYESEFSVFGVEEIGQFEEAGSEASNTLEKFLRIISGLQKNETNERETQTIEILEDRKLSREISTGDEDFMQIKNEPLLSPVRSHFVKRPQESDDDDEDCLFLKRKVTRNGDEMEEEIEEEADDDEEELSVDSDEVVRERIEDAESLLIRQGRMVKIDFSKKEFTGEQLTDICSNFDLSNQRIRHFEVDFSGSSLEDNHLEVLSQNLFQKKEISELDSFMFDCSNTSIGDTCFAVLKDALSLSAKTLEKVELVLDSTDIEGDNICDIFSKMNHLRHLKLSFEKSAIFSAGISFLFSSLRHVASNLESLDLNFNTTEIDDDCLKILINDVILLMKKPKYLRISLGNTNLSNKIMMNLFQTLKLVTVHFTTFELDLHQTCLYNTALTYLLKDTLKEMLNLEHLKLDFSETKINNDGLKHLSLASLKLKSLSMNLNETHISDEGLEILKKNLIGPRIEKLDVQLENTFVNEEALEKFGNYLKKKTQQQQIKSFNLNMTPQKRKGKRAISSYAPSEKAASSPNSTPKKNTSYSNNCKGIIPPLIKEKILLDLRKPIMAEARSRMNIEQVSLTVLLQLIEKVGDEAFEKVLMKILATHISTFNTKTADIKQWRAKVLTWINSLSLSGRWSSWLVVHGKFGLFREKLIQILKSMSCQTFSILRQRVLKILDEIFRETKNCNQKTPSLHGYKCCWSWWKIFLRRNQDIKDLWERLSTDKEK